MKTHYVTTTGLRCDNCGRGLSEHTDGRLCPGNTPPTENRDAIQAAIKTKHPKRVSLADLPDYDG